jgi:hypothetical protein
MSDAVLEYGHLLLTLPRDIRHSVHFMQQSRSPFVRGVDRRSLGLWTLGRWSVTLAIGVLLLGWAAVVLVPARVPSFALDISGVPWLGSLVALMVLRRLVSMECERCAMGERRQRRGAG